MPPNYRVAQPVGTPISPPTSISVSGSESLLIVFAVVVMLLLATVFLLGVWYFLNRLKAEQTAVELKEQNNPSPAAVGGPGSTRPRRDFTPQADLLDHDEYG